MLWRLRLSFLRPGQSQSIDHEARQRTEKRQKPINWPDSAASFALTLIWWDMKRQCGTNISKPANLLTMPRRYLPYDKEDGGT